jgi:hypothetical protein
MIKHLPEPPPIPHRDSSWPRFRRNMDLVLLPVITAAILAGVSSLISLREDMAVMRVEIAQIKEQLNRAAGTK